MCICVCVCHGVYDYVYVYDINTDTDTDTVCLYLCLHLCALVLRCLDRMSVSVIVSMSVIVSLSVACGNKVDRRRPAHEGTWSECRNGLSSPARRFGVNLVCVASARTHEMDQHRISSPCPPKRTRTWGGWILTLHLHLSHVAGYTDPLLLLFELIHYPVDDQWGLPWWLCCLAGPLFRSAL